MKITILILFTLALHLVALIHSGPSRMVAGDTAQYEALAASLAHGSFSGPDGLPEVHRTPGYPLFIAACGGSRWVVGAVQALLAVATVGLVWWLGKRLAGARAGLMAAAMLALEPLTFYYAHVVLSETLFVFLLVAAVCAALMAIREEDWRWCVATGILLALACYVRPVALYLWLLVGLIICIRRYGDLFYLMVITVAFAALTLPWCWRCEPNDFVVPCGQSFYTQALRVDRMAHGMGAFAAAALPDEKLSDGKLETARRMEHREADKWIERDAWAIYAAHPWLKMKLTAANAVRIAFFQSTGELRRAFGMDARVARLWVLGSLWLLVTGLALFIWRGRLGWTEHALLLGTAAYLLAVSALFLGEIRMRVPMMWIVALYAGMGWAGLKKEEG